METSLQTQVLRPLMGLAQLVVVLMVILNTSLHPRCLFVQH
jgi:lipopolysaccharide export LptBFGC system permease protein LptF